MKFTPNIPNLLTILRIVLVPFFIYCVLQPELVYRAIAFAMFIVASFTDMVDGYLARKFNQESEFGKFWDPMADKMLVISTLIVLILLEMQIQLWMVFIIIGRDMMVTAMRFLAVRKGASLRTSRFGKAKTAFQMFSIFIILLIIAIRSQPETRQVNDYYRDNLHRADHFTLATEKFVDAVNMKISGLGEFIVAYSYSLPYFLMLLTTIITALSGLRYLYTNWRLLLPPYPLSRPPQGVSAPRIAGPDRAGEKNKGEENS